MFKKAKMCHDAICYALRCIKIAYNEFVTSQITLFFWVPLARIMEASGLYITVA